MHARTPLLCLLAAASCALLIAACGSEDSGTSCTIDGLTINDGASARTRDCRTCTCTAGALRCSAPSCGDAGFDTGGNDTGGSDTGGNDTGGSDVVGPGECRDSDNDGFYSCLDPLHPERPQEVDCDDSDSTVQPGAYDFFGNRVDDDCDGEIDNTPRCGCPTGVTGPNMLEAIELCDGSIVSATMSGNNAAFDIATRYEGALGPRSGNCLSVISSGTANPASAGVQPGTEFSVVGVADPDPAGTGELVYDLAQLVVELDPPNNARGFQFDFMFLSSEWPEFLCQTFNDTYYTIATIPGFTPGSQNISFDSNGDDVTVNVGFFEQPAAWTTNLVGTSMAQNDVLSNSCGGILGGGAPGCTMPGYCSGGATFREIGSGSGWLTTQAPVTQAGGNIQLVFSIHDEGDSSLDSVVLIDAFEWLPYEPEINTVKE